MKTLKIGLIAVSVTIVGGLSSALLWNGVAHGEWSLPGLQQQVQHVTEVTQNHEGRITNLEGKVNTPSDQPTPTPIVITKVVTQAAPANTATPNGTSSSSAQPVAEPTPTPEPYIKYFVTDRTTDCDGNVIYSYRVHWSDGRPVVRQSNRPTSGIEYQGDSGGCVKNQL